MRQSFKSIHISRLILAFLLVGLTADLIPHPALGPSFLVRAVQSLAQPATAAE